MTDRVIIGQRIAELRKNKGLTQAELADLIGVSHQAVSQWERSETLPDILTIPALAEIFGESISAVMGIEELKSDNENAEEPESPETAEAPNGEVEINCVYSEPKNRDSNGSCQIGVNGYTLPTTNKELNFEKDEYEIVIVKNGEIIQRFKQNPDNFVTVVVSGNVYSLRSEMSVNVEGMVCGDAESGFGMTVGGSVGGNVKSGFDTKCGDVAGNVKAGFGVNCGDIGGNASGGFGVKSKGKAEGEQKSSNFNWVGDKKNENNPVDLDVNVDVNTDIKNETSDNGKTVTIDGDYDGDLIGAENIIINGDLNGNISDCKGNVTVQGDVSGDINAGGYADIGGDVDGDVNAGERVNVGGDVDGDVSAGDGTSIGGDVNGDVSAGDGVNVGGNVDGDVSAGDGVNVGGDVEGDVDGSGDITVGGDVNGDLTSNGDGNVRISGDVNGDVSGNNVTIEGDLNS